MAGLRERDPRAGPNPTGWQVLPIRTRPLQAHLRFWGTAPNAGAGRWKVEKHGGRKALRHGKEGSSRAKIPPKARGGGLVE